MELQAILDAFTANPELIKGVLPVVVDAQVGKDLIEARATILYKEKIADEVKTIYSKIDDDIFAIIGERPSTADGKMEKTYDFIKRKITDLKAALDNDATLSADERITKLTGQIEELKKGNGGEFMKQQWDAAAANWKKEKEELENKITTMGETNTNAIKKAEIATGLAGIKFNPDTQETIKTMVLNNIEAELLKNSKIEDGKVVFLTPDGKPIMNPTNTGPAVAADVLAMNETIKAISLKDDSKGGGGAPPAFTGKVGTKNVEGKDVKTIDLGPKGTFANKLAFVSTFEKAMAEAGIAKGDPDYTKIEADAYTTHDVGNLPTE